jgi:hypothetical protein
MGDELFAICGLLAATTLVLTARDPYLHKCTEHGAPEVEGLPGN